jgi:DNA-binding GntR family transcriptional regulator
MVNNSKDSRQLVQSKILERIRRDILAGRYRPGERLKIRVLASELEVSTMPVREALRHLQVEGLVKGTPHVGVTVSELSLEDVEELYRIRLPLELQASELAMENIESDDLAALAKLVERMETAEPYRWLGLNRKFHLTIYTLANSPRLVRIISSLWDTLEPYLGVFISTVGRDLEKPNREHQQILDALAAKDFPTVKRITTLHLLDTKVTVQEALRSPEGWPSSASTLTTRRDGRGYARARRTGSDSRRSQVAPVS